MKQSVVTIIVWGVVQLLILLGCMFLWNLILPSLSLTRISFFQMTGLYALIKLLNFDWVKAFLESSQLKNKENGSK
jgi:hypothetical protein